MEQSGHPAACDAAKVNTGPISRTKVMATICPTCDVAPYVCRARDICNAITAPLATAMIAIAANNREIFNSAASAGQTTYPDALRILFVIICSTVWVGLSTSLQSIVKERAIFIRERAFNLLPEAYLASKALVMAGQAVLQATLVALSVLALFESPEDISHWPLSIGVIAFVTLLTRPPVCSAKSG